jgi:predicted NUDIX family NTP pyrophosphohydrolase
MPARSAGFLIYRRRSSALEVLLVHPGGPFWARRDAGSWSIPKGEIGPDEDALAAARREVAEELGSLIDGPAVSLAPITQKAGKVVEAWAVEHEWDPTTLHSNTFTIEWPRGSGRMTSFPEVDRAEWFGLDEARRRILPGQVPLLDQLESLVSRQ